MFAHTWTRGGRDNTTRTNLWTSSLRPASALMTHLPKNSGTGRTQSYPRVIIQPLAGPETTRAQTICATDQVPRETMSSPTAIMPSTVSSERPSAGLSYPTSATQVRLDISSQCPPTEFGEEPTNHNLNFTPQTDDSGNLPLLEPPTSNSRTAAGPSGVVRSTTDVFLTSPNNFCKELVDQLRREFAAGNHTLYLNILLICNTNIIKIRNAIRVDLGQKVKRCYGGPHRPTRRPQPQNQRRRPRTYQLGSTSSASQWEILIVLHQSPGGRRPAPSKIAHDRPPSTTSSRST